MKTSIPDSSLPHVQDARRYLANAKEILADKAKKEDGFYVDKKYVKMAGHTAYAGVLVALDSIFEKQPKKRKSIEWYTANLAKTDKKLLSTFNSAYEILHLFMAYDGTQDAEVVAAGLKRATTIIDWVETRTTQQG